MACRVHSPFRKLTDMTRVMFTRNRWVKYPQKTVEGRAWLVAGAWSLVVFPAIWLFMLYTHARLTRRGGMTSPRKATCTVQCAFAFPVLAMMAGGFLIIIWG